MHAEGIVIKVTEELAGQVVQTNRHNETYYYAHNDDRHRAVWVTEGPIAKLIGKLIQITMSVCYGSERIALPQYIGKKHILIKMINLNKSDAKPVSVEKILEAAPRNEVIGRRQKVQNGVIIKASVPKEMADLFRTLGEGNVSEGVRLAGKMLELQLK